MLRLFLFGFPSVTLNDSPVKDFISQKSLILLCYLALEPHTHARESLAGLFWGDLPQERALGNLRQALHNLQKLLPDYVIVTRQTAAFDTSRPHSLDTGILDSGTTADDLMTRYREGFMAGVVIADGAEIEHWISRQRAHYDLRYTAQLTALAADLFARREMAQAGAVVQRLIAHDPYHEAAYRLLWRIYVYQGRIADALASSHALTGLLRRDLDIALAAETQRLAGQLALAQGVAQHNIPAASAPLVGREADLAQLGVLLEKPECRLVTLCGVGGVGKTRIAQEFGRVQAGLYLNGTAYIPLAALTDTLYLPTVLAEALGVTLQNVRDPQREIEVFLAAREMLLIFDNAEQVAGFAGWLSELLRGAPFVRVIVTSRERLELREEWVMPLECLPYGESPDATSVDLLVQSAARGGQPVARDGDAAALCALLEGLPLGIELAGAMLVSGGTSALLHAVRANLDHVQARWVNAEPHHRSLRAVFQTSWERLSAAEQTALANLAIFDVPFTAAGAKTVAGADVVMLQRLVACSLLREQGDRWGIHAVIRTYARALQTSPERLADRFVTYYLRVVAQADAEFLARNTTAGVAVMRAEIDGLRQFWQMAERERNMPLLIELSFTLHRFYEGGGWFAEGLALFRKSIGYLALDRRNPQEWDILGRLRMHEAGMLLRLGMVTEALACAREAVECLSQYERDPDGLAFALNAYGVAQLYTGEMDAARQTLLQCAAIYRALDKPELLKPLVNLGAIYTRTGDIESARAVLEEAHALARFMGDGVGTFHIANSLGLNHMLCDEYEAAVRYFADALSLSEATGFRSGQAVVLNNLGDVHTLLGVPDAGIGYAQEAVALARELQDQRALVYALTTQTLAQLALKSPEAATTLREALQIALETQAAPLLTAVIYAAGEWYASVNQPERAGICWRVVAAHPATEMDYRRRARRCLDVTPDAAPSHAPDISALAEDILTSLSVV